ncbi:unnamed protein product [Diamesa serratosioi]
MSVPWLNLPDEVWVVILGHLNVKTLLTATETCTRLNDVTGKSKKLMKMIRLNIDVPVNKFYCEGKHYKFKGLKLIKALKENLLMSDRIYQNSGISLVDKIKGWSIPFDAIMTNILIEVCEIFTFFSRSIIDFKIQNSTIENKVFVKIISIFMNLQKCNIEITEIYGDYDDFSLKLPNLEHISLLPMKNLMIENFFISFDNLKSLNIVGYNKYYYDQFDMLMYYNLLRRQKHLKVFRARCPEIFGQDVFSNTEFSLESLSLKCENWKNMDHAESFFKTQKNLKDIHLKLNDNAEGLNFRFNDIMKQIFSLNHNLSEIKIKIKFKIVDVTFLDGICLPEVKTLSFKSKVENNQLFAALIKMCPNVKKLTYISESEDIDYTAINTIVELESLKIFTTSQSIQNLLIYSTHLKHFSMLYDCDQQLSAIAIFLSNHQSIEHLVLQNMHVSQEMCEQIVNCLPNLRSFMFSSLETPTESMQLLSTLKYLRSLKSTWCQWMEEVGSNLCTNAGIGIEMSQGTFSNKTLKFIYNFSK